MSDYKIHDDYALLGAVKYDTKWQFYYADLLMWILDYPAYNPNFNPADEMFSWRGGLEIIDSENALAFCKLLGEFEVPASKIPFVTYSSNGYKAEIYFMVNFDEKLYVSGWSENIALEEYIPNGWIGKFDDPYLYIPEEIKKSWYKP